MPPSPLNILCVYGLYAVDHQHFPIYCTQCVWLSKSMWHCAWASAWICICLYFAWEDSTPSSLLHTSAYTYSALFYQQTHRLNVTHCLLSSLIRYENPLRPSVSSISSPLWSKTLMLQLNVEQASAIIVLKVYALCLFLDLGSVYGCVCRLCLLLEHIAHTGLCFLCGLTLHLGVAAAAEAMTHAVRGELLGFRELN